MFAPRRKHPNRNAAAQGDILPQGAAARVPVLLPFPFAGPFDYRVPAGMNPQPGDVVLVPLNRREEVGVVWDGPADGSVGDNRLRPIAGLLDVQPMRPDIRRLVDWISRRDRDGRVVTFPFQNGQVVLMAPELAGLDFRGRIHTLDTATREVQGGHGGQFYLGLRGKF